MKSSEGTVHAASPGPDRDGVPWSTMKVERERFTFLLCYELSSSSPGNPKWLVETCHVYYIRHRGGYAGHIVRAHGKEIQGHKVV